MLTLVIVFGCIAVGTTFFGIKYYALYHKANKLYQKTDTVYNKLKEEYLFKGRKGVYVHTFCGAKAYVHVKEIERYNNNISKIKLVRSGSGGCVEIFEGTGDEARWCYENARETFASIKDTNDITWLELNTKDARKKKLEQIEKNIENEN